MEALRLHATADATERAPGMGQRSRPRAHGQGGPMAIALPVSRAPARRASSDPAAPVSHRALPALASLLGLFVAMPWAVRPLDRLLPADEVSLLGQIAETVIGVALGA